MLIKQLMQIIQLQAISVNILNIQRITHQSINT